MEISPTWWCSIAHVGVLQRPRSTRMYGCGPGESRGEHAPGIGSKAIGEASCRSGASYNRNQHKSRALCGT